MTTAKRKGRGRYSPKRLADFERAREAVRMRKAGASFDQIKEALAYSDRAAAWRAVGRELERARNRTVGAMREQEGDKLDLLMDALWPGCTADPPNLESVKVFILCARRKAKLWGLDVVLPPTATATAAVQIVYQIGAGKPRELHELTDAELVAVIRELESQGTPQIPILASQNEQHAGSSAEGDV
jgi:hypothetical protein